MGPGGQKQQFQSSIGFKDKETGKKLSVCVKVDRVYSYNRMFNGKTNEQNLHKSMTISKTKLNTRVKSLKKYMITCILK